MTDIEEELKKLEGQYTDSDEDSSQEQILEQELESQEDEDIEQLIEDLYCVACDKLFNTAGARDNHETSKKHRQNMRKTGASAETSMCEERRHEIRRAGHRQDMFKPQYTKV